MIFFNTFFFFNNGIFIGFFYLRMFFVESFYPLKIVLFLKFVPFLGRCYSEADLRQINFSQYRMQAQKLVHV